jgi:hypothetical protein
MSLNSCLSRHSSNDIKTKKVVYNTFYKRNQNYSLDTFIYERFYGIPYIEHIYKSSANKIIKKMHLSADLNYVVFNGDTMFVKLGFKDYFPINQNNGSRVSIYYNKEILECGGGVLYFVSDEYGLICEMSTSRYAHSRILAFCNEDSLTVNANILSDKCLFNYDWHDRINYGELKAWQNKNSNDSLLH